MKKKIVKLTENDLQRIVEKVINEDFVTRLIAKGKGLVAALKARRAGEGKDVRQIINAITRLKSIGQQSEPFIYDLKVDLEKTFKEHFMNKTTEYNKSAMSNKGIDNPINEFSKFLERYQKAVNEIITCNNLMQQINLTDSPMDTTTKPPNDEIAV